MENNKPECFTPEENVCYPLCVGEDNKKCKDCNLHISFGDDNFDSIDQ